MVQGSCWLPGCWGRDPQALFDEVRKAWETPDLLERLSRDAQYEFETKYTEASNYETLRTIYGAVMSVNRERNKK